MTKERRLAIKMWKGIHDMLIGNNVVTGRAIVEYKLMFCKSLVLRWTNNCWFCKYIPDCSKCPLDSCRIDSDYDNVKNNRLDKDVRVEACNAIIKALGGSV